jgi:SAM-dependent methyltransferase
MRIGRLAPWYRWIEYAAFGRALERCRCEFLSRLSSSKRILVLGEGDGRTLARMLQTAPLARFDVVELSPAMIWLARRRTRDSPRVAFHCQDAQKVSLPDAGYDAIVTHFFLDCFSEEQARELIHRLSQALAPGGVWLLGDFALPDSGWRRLHAQLWLPTMYLFFRVTTGLSANALPPLESLMLEAGMLRTERQTTRAGLITSELWMPSRAPRTSE